MNAPRPPAPTKCAHCGYSNGGAFSVCPLCKKDVNAPVHPGDMAVGAAAAALALVVLPLIATGVI